MNVLVNAFFLAALLPFLSPLPAPSDVQLPAFIIATVIIVRDIVRGRFRLNRVEGLFLAIGVWSFFFVLPGNPFNGRERIGILCAFLVYYVVKKYADRFSTRTLFVALVGTLGSSLIQLARPDVYGAIAPLFIRTVKDLSEGGRGMSGPSAEPSFLAAIALVHGLLVIYYYAVGRLRRGGFWAALAMSAASLLLSKSATGFMYLGVLAGIAAGYYAFRGMTVGRWIALFVSIAVLFAIVLGPLAQSRGGAILVALYENPGQVLGDGSAQERVRCLTIGALAATHYPVGVGGGGFPGVAVEMNRVYGLQTIFYQAREESVVGILNAGGMYFAELGLVFGLLLAAVFSASMRLEVLSLLFSALALLFIVFSFSITFPMTWLLLGLTARKNFLFARRSSLRPQAA